MATTKKSCRHSRRSPVGRLGRLVWACLLCRDRVETGLDREEAGTVTRGRCSVHGKDYVKKVRI